MKPSLLLRVRCEYILLTKRSDSSLDPFEDLYWFSTQNLYVKSPNHAGTLGTRSENNKQRTS